MEALHTDDFFDLIGVIPFNNLGVFFLNFLIPFIAIEVLHTSGIVMGILFSLQTFGLLLSTIFTGFFADRFSKKNLLAISSIARGLSYLLLYLSIISLTLDSLFISNFLLGFFSGMFWISFDSLIADKTVKEYRSQAYGMRSASQGKGIFIGAIVGFGILLIFSQDQLLMFSALVIFGLLNIFSSITYFTKISDSKIHIEDELNTDQTFSYQNLKIDFPVITGIILIIVIIIFFAMEESINQSFVIPYFLNTLSSNASLAIFIYIPVGFVSIFLGPNIGKLIDRTSYTISISICCIASGFSIFLLIQTSSLLFFSIILTINEIFTLAIALLLVNIFSSFSNKHRGKIIGIKSFFTNFGGILGSLIGGFSWQIYSVQTPFIFSIVLDIAMVPLFIICLQCIKPYLKK